MEDFPTLLWVPREQECNAIFREAAEGNPIVSKHVYIRHDGGFTNPEFLEERLYSWKRVLLSVIMPLMFITVNVTYTVHDFYDVLRDYYVDKRYVKHTWKIGKGKPIFFAFFTDVHQPTSQEYFWYGRLFVAGFELAALTAFALKALWVVIKFNFFATEEQLGEFGIWSELYEVACNIWRTMTNFSGMKTMVFLNHMTIGPGFAYYIADFPKDASNMDYAVGFAMFMTKRLVTGSLGFLAFIIKIAEIVNEIISDSVLHPDYEVDGRQLLIVIPFMIQVFGITQLWRINEARFFLGVFGGTDARMHKDARDRCGVFTARLSQTIFSRLFVGDPYCGVKRTLALVSVHHTDLQALLVAEDPLDPLEEALNPKAASYGSFEGEP